MLVTNIGHASYHSQVLRVIAVSGLIGTKRAGRKLVVAAPTQKWVLGPERKGSKNRCVFIDEKTSKSSARIASAHCQFH
jgi:hypothetical protein